MISLWAFLNGNQCGAGLSDTCVGYSAADFIVLRRTYNQRVLSVLENEILVGGRCVYLEWESGNEHPWESKNFYALFSSFLDDNADFIDTAIKVKPY